MPMFKVVQRGSVNIEVPKNLIIIPKPWQYSSICFQEANGELLSHNSSALHNGPRLLNPTSGFNRQWSLSQLVAEFSELCQWLTHVQEEIYSSPENLSSRKLRMVSIDKLLVTYESSLDWVLYSIGCVLGWLMGNWFIGLCKKKPIAMYYYTTDALSCLVYFVNTKNDFQIV